MNNVTKVDEAPSTTARPWLAIVVITLLVVGGVFAGLVLVEIGVRILHPEQTGTVAWNDRPSRFYLPQGGLGISNYPYETEKPAGVYRIVVIGDSFTFAPMMQMDDTFTARLGRWFNLNREQSKVEVINLGHSGDGTEQEVSAVKQALTTLNPDLILLQITLNDPQDEAGGGGYLTGEQFIARIREQHPWVAKWRSLMALVRGVVNRNTHKKYIEFYENLYQGASLERFQKGLKTIRDLCQATNVSFGAVIFPLYSHQFDKSYPFAKLHTIIDNTLAELHVPHIDLLHAYTGIPPERLQVFPGHDLHPNEIAHRIAAEEIYQWLRKKKLVPPSIAAKRTIKDRSGRVVIDVNPTPKRARKKGASKVEPKEDANASAGNQS